MNEFFRKFAAKISKVVGSGWAFILAVTIIIVWAITGPVFDFSDTWQLIINTGTTIITFLMVFLIQNTQNRDAKAIHLKLDELIHGLRGPHTGFVDLEEMTDEELEELEAAFRGIREKKGLSVKEFVKEVEQEGRSHKPKGKQ
ncbi:MAG TPA: low affinity iron permease family protein [Blastocatellia bacterium]|nr:low affinity iron permease family protein [Blastocatellia bacterium]